MRILFLILLCFILLSSCDDNISDTQESAVDNTNQQIPSIASFDFIKNFESDNFYKQDINGKNITIANLIVDGYEIDNNGTAKLFCMAYSPEKSKIYLMNRYGGILYNIYANGYSSENMLRVQVGNKNLEWIKDGYLDGERKEPSPDGSHDFLIILTNPKDIKNISFYNGAESKKNFRYSSYKNIRYYYMYNDIITINGVYKNSEYNNPRFVFENCTIAKNENINYSDSEINRQEKSDDSSINATYNNSVSRQRGKYINDSIELNARISKENNQLDSPVK